MKGIVLAGGIGSRLYPLTRVTNKHLLPVYDKPMIFYPLQILVDAGIRDIHDCHRRPQCRRLSAPAAERQGIRTAAAQLRLSGGRGRHCRRAASGRALGQGDKICVVLGDNIIEGDIKDAATKFEQLEKGAMVMLKEVTDPERFGVPVFEERTASSASKRSPRSRSRRYAVIGVYFYDVTVFDRIRRLKPSGRGEYEITDVNNSYIEEGTLHHSLLEGWWTDAGTFESLWHASNMVREKVLRGTEESCRGAWRMKLLITGGAGFIGSNFVHQTMAKHPDWKLVVLDKLTYAGNLKNLEPALSEGRCEFVQMDICDRGVVDAGARLRRGDSLRRRKPRRPQHRRCVGVRAHQRRWHTQHAAGVPRRPACRGSYTSSTDEVYGSLGDEGDVLRRARRCSPTARIRRPRRRRTCWCWPTFTPTSFPAIVTRCSNNYGPYQFPEKFIPLMIAQAMAGERCRFTAKARNVRDWIHVDDHCSALDTVLQQGREGEVYNIGGGCEMQNLDVAKLILKSLGQSEELIQFVTDRPGHDLRYAINCRSWNASWDGAASAVRQRPGGDDRVVSR